MKCAVGDTFEISDRDDMFVVDLNKTLYSCREWDLIDILSKHTCACINYMRQDPIMYVDNFYYKKIYIATYENALISIIG